MKIKRSDALQLFNGLHALERNADNKPYDFTFETWDKIFQILSCIAPVVDAYTNARKQKFIKASDGKAIIEDPDANLTFQMEDSATLEAIISVKLPKVLLTEDELRLSANKIPPSIRVQLKPVVPWKTAAELDEDENDY